MEGLLGVSWELIDLPDGGWYSDEREYKQYGNRGLGGYQCQCGRFAKYRGNATYYNGTWNIHYTDVLCSRCGEVRVRHT